MCTLLCMTIAQKWVEPWKMPTYLIWDVLHTQCSLLCTMVCCLKGLWSIYWQYPWLGLPQHKLKQDEPTRWNYTLYMLQSIAEQKIALAAYSSEYGLSSHQLDFVNKFISCIKSNWRDHKINFCKSSIMSAFILMLEKRLEKHHDNSGVQTIKPEILTSLKQCGMLVPNLMKCWQLIQGSRMEHLLMTHAMKWTFIIRGFNWVSW